MIYIGKVKPSLMNEPIDRNIIDFFKNYRLTELDIPNSKEEQGKLKTSILKGFISGEMSALVRNNNNLVSRDCLIIDLDDVIISENELVKVIKDKFNKFQYVLYPSISHGMKGVRYRLVLPLDDSINEAEYKLLVHYANKKILEGIVGQADDSNATWSQLMLLPVITQYTMEESIVINDVDKMLPVKDLLKGAEIWSSKLQPKEQKFVRPGYFKGGGYRSRNTTTNLFESLVIGCSEGNRNNRIAQITGGLLARAVEIDLAYKLILVANENFDDPLPIDELDATFKSIVHKELKVD